MFRIYICLNVLERKVVGSQRSNTIILIIVSRCIDLQSSVGNNVKNSASQYFLTVKL